MKKYLISGIGPGSSGVGRLMNVLVPEYRAKGYRVITTRPLRSIRQLLEDKRYVSAAAEVFLRNADKLLFNVRCLSIRGNEIVFLHPQTAGYWIFFYLTFLNRVSLYVMDNSFFCIRSYNTHPLNRGECLECLSNISPHPLCAPFPEKIPKKINIFYLNLLRKIYLRLSYLAQNKLQSELLASHFGENICVSVVGMNSESVALPGDRYAFSEDQSHNSIPYDVVFHGTSNAAKGLFYLLEIAELMPGFSFLVPDKLSNVSRIVGASPADNVSCVEMTWETGLKEAVASARLVINPSMWSAPIEGALVKSFKYNQNVATVETKYGYEAEVETIYNHIRLPRNPLLGSEILRKFFKDLR